VRIVMVVCLLALAGSAAAIRDVGRTISDDRRDAAAGPPPGSLARPVSRGTPDCDPERLIVPRPSLLRISAVDESLACNRGSSCCSWKTPGSRSPLRRSLRLQRHFQIDWKRPTYTRARRPLRHPKGPACDARLQDAQSLPRLIVYPGSSVGPPGCAHRRFAMMGQLERGDAP